ncbi:N-acetylmuramoyl-L-alanine amidase [Lachnospiraceae bacterium XBB1006]|nr:N-acetylmuramoyl-L-alanine amidase [Lachnospiraceae bacterium XBB1006]
MEEKVIKKFTILMVSACLVICISLVYLPKVTMRAGALVAKYMAAREEARMREEMNALELMRLHEQEISAKLRKKLGYSIRLTKFEGHALSEVTIKENPVRRKVELVFPGAKEAGLNRYPIIGSTRYLTDMKVSDTKAGLKISFETDRVVVPALSKEKGFCYLTLKKPREVYDRIVVIDAGHGGKMPGAVVGGVKEKTVNLQIVKALKKYLDKDSSIKAYYTRLDDAHVELYERVRLANEVRANLFISIHQNAMGSYYSSVEGTQVLYSETKKGSHKSKELASILLKETTKAFRSKDKGLVPGNRIFIIRNAKVPVSLVEVGFVSSKAEQKRLTNPVEQKKIAKGLYDGIQKALEKGF